MKLKELFDKYTFDEILPYMKAIEPERSDSMYQFREALDLLEPHGAFERGLRRSENRVVSG